MQAKRARDRAQEFPAKCTRKTDDERVKMESGEEETRASLNSNTKKMALFERKSWQKNEDTTLSNTTLHKHKIKTYLSFSIT